MEPAVEPVTRPRPRPVDRPRATGTGTGTDPTAVPGAVAVTAAAGPVTTTPPIEVRLELPAQKKTHTHLYGRLVRERALEHTPGLPRHTAQADNWDRELRPGGAMEIYPDIWRRFENRGTPEARRLRPNWTRQIERLAMQVDHRVEWQLLNTANRSWGDSMPNYELLDQPSNGSAGATLAANIAEERNRLETLTGNPGWQLNPIVFTRLIAPNGPPSGQRWLPDEIQQGHHYHALVRHERGRY